MFRGLVTSTARRARLPSGLIGMLGLVILIESTLARGELDLTWDPWWWDWHVGAISASNRARDSDVLCFGDSLVKHAIAPGVLEARTGLRAYNLALGGGLAPTSYFQLKRALDSGARPKAIVVDFWPDLLRHDPIVNTRLHAQVATLRDCLDLGWTTGDGRLLALVTLEHLFPSIRCRNQIRLGSLAALRGGSSSMREKVLPFWRNWRANRGAMIVPQNPAFEQLIGGLVENIPGEASKTWHRALYPESWDVSEASRAYMLRFFELAEAEKIPVFYLLTPIHPAVQVRRERLGIDKAHTRFARAIADRFPGVTVVDARHANYEGRVFTDFLHLDRHGASDLTADLADVLGPILGGRADRPRWVDLPGFRGRPNELAIEDLDQSRLAVSAKDGSTIR